MLTKVAGAEDVANLFPWLLHMAVVDRYGGNLRAERSILHDTLQRSASAADPKKRISKLTCRARIQCQTGWTDSLINSFTDRLTD